MTATTEAIQAAIVARLNRVEAVPLTREVIEDELSRACGCRVTLGDADPVTGAYKSAFVHLPQPVRTITIEGIIEMYEQP